MATITHRTWHDRRGELQERWDVEYLVDGKRRQETCSSLEEAEDRVAEIRTDRRRGTYIDPADGRVTLRTYVYETWLPAKNFDEGTRQQVVLRLETHVLPELGKLRLSQFRASTIRKWLTELPGAQSSRSVIFIHVNDIFSSAVDDELIGRNPCQAASVLQKRPRQPITPVKSVWTPEQVNGLWDGMTDRYDVVVPMGARIGLRIGEMLGLSPWDVDFLNGVVHVRRQVKRLTDGRRVFALPKYEKVREVPLFDGARDALAEYMTRYSSTDVTLPWKHPEDGAPTTVPLIIATPTGGSVDASAFNSGPWRQGLKRAGIPWVSRKTGPHQLRHYCASVWLSMGYTEVDVAEWLGHADPAFTLKVYTHFIKRPDDHVRRQALEEFHARREPVNVRSVRTGANEVRMNSLRNRKKRP